MILKVLPVFLVTSAMPVRKGKAVLGSIQKPPPSPSEPINICCPTATAPPKLLSTQRKWRAVKSLLRMSLVRLVADIRACAFQKDGLWSTGTSPPPPHHSSSPAATFMNIYWTSGHQDDARYLPALAWKLLRAGIFVCLTHCCILWA